MCAVNLLRGYSYPGWHWGEGWWLRFMPLSCPLVHPSVYELGGWLGRFTKTPSYQYGDSLCKPGSVFCPLLRVSSGCTWPITGQVTYFRNLACDWVSILWAYSEQETENGPWCGFRFPSLPSLWVLLVQCHQIFSDQIFSRLDHHSFR